MYYNRIGHHTCIYNANIQQVLLQAPFKSTYDEQKGMYNFLGTGYYLWEDDLDLAIWWGNVHYKKRNKEFLVIEMTMKIYDDELLDLMGNARQIREFREMYFKTQKKLGYNLTIGKFIEFLKQIGAFEFKIIKALINQPYDYDNKTKYFVRFVAIQKTFLNLQPRIFYCFLENSTKYFYNKKLKYNSKTQTIYG